MNAQAWIDAVQGLGIILLSLYGMAATRKHIHLTKRVEGLAAEVAKHRTHRHKRSNGEVLEPGRVRVSDARFTPRRMETGADTEV